MATMTELQQKNSIAIMKPTFPLPQHENQVSGRVVATGVQRVGFWTGCVTVLMSLVKSILLTARVPATASSPWLHYISAAAVGYVAADLVTGIYHWAIDNYGTAETPIFGPQIEGFLCHHQQPQAITRCDLANKLHIPAVVAAILVLPIYFMSSDLVLLEFVGVFAGFAMFSQQFHAWAHTPKRNIPAVVVALQDAGLILGRAEHAAHHRPPYNSNYCIVSGVWNRFLGKTKFFVALEVVVLRLFGVEPRSWRHPDSGM